MKFILATPIETRLAILFVLGCCVGGAINLGIYRLAWHAQPISPWSRPASGAPRRRWWDGLPVFGWLGLRREAALNGAGFWIRPMLLEIATGALFAALYWWEIAHRGLVPNGLTMLTIVPDLPTLRHEQFVAHLVLLFFMLIAFWIDIDEMSIPDAVTIPGTLLGLALVTLWPYALLPDSPNNRNGPWGFPMAIPIWLTSPDEVLPVRLNVPPLFLMPWQRPALLGVPALAAMIAGFCVWCMALMPGMWSTRHGYLRAMRVFTARAARERATYGLLSLAAIGSLAIFCVWRTGGPHWAALESSLAGMAMGGGMVWIIRVLSSAVIRREAMGFGDVTLLAMIGAFLGWQAAVIVFFLAPLVAVAFAVGRLVLQGEREIPFGPFLCVAAASLFFIWPAVWEHFADTMFALGWKLIALLAFCLCLVVLLLPPVRWLLSRLTGVDASRS